MPDLIPLPPGMSLRCPAHVVLVPKLHLQKVAVLGFGPGLQPSNVRIRHTGVLPSVSTAEATSGGILCQELCFGHRCAWRCMQGGVSEGHEQEPWHSSY